MDIFMAGDNRLGALTPRHHRCTLNISSDNGVHPRGTHDAVMAQILAQLPLYCPRWHSQLQTSTSERGTLETPQGFMSPSMCFSNGSRRMSDLNCANRRSTGVTDQAECDWEHAIP